MKFFVSKIIGLLILLSSCTNIIENDNNQTTPYNANEKLILISKTRNYTISQKEMENILLNFLNGINQSENNNRTVLNEINLSLVDTDNIKIDISKESRAVTYNNLDENLFLYEFSSNSQKNYALTTTDTRLGNILAIFPEEIFENSEYIKFLTDSLENYIETTNRNWNFLWAKQQQNSRAIRTNIYNFENWKFNSGNTNNLLKTNWGQKSNYNDAIESVYGKDYLTGCATTAIAQLIAFHKPTMKMFEKCYTTLSSKWASIENWDGSYNWAEMVKYPTITDLSSIGRIQVSALMYEIAERFDANYGTSSTGVNRTKLSPLLKSIGFHNDGLKSYSFSSVKNSIDSSRPLVARGYSNKTSNYIKILWKKIRTGTSYSGGHVWIIDGYANLTCTLVDDSGNEEEYTDYFVHCNPGWYGTNNGYYISGIFDFTKNGTPTTGTNFSRHSSDNSNESHYYQWEMQIIPNIYFDGNYESIDFGVAYNPEEEEDE